MITSIQCLTNHSAVPDNGQSLGDAVHSGGNVPEVILTDGFLRHVERAVIRRHALYLTTTHTHTHARTHILSASIKLVYLSDGVKKA